MDGRFDFQKTAEKYLKRLSKLEKREIGRRVRSIRKKYMKLVGADETKTRSEIDPMFFSFEDLPPFGKEYWFMKFTSSIKGDRRQMLTMFGDSAEDITINKKRVRGEDSPNFREGYAVGWLFEQKKKVLVDNNCVISILPKGGEMKLISSSRKGNLTEFEGKFPNYRLKIWKDGAKVCDLRMRPRRKGRKYEFASFLKILRGFSLINLYLECEGTVNGKKFRADAYVQKVILIGPFVPWYWGRVGFENGSNLEYFTPRIELANVKYELTSDITFYDALANKTHFLKKFRIMKVGKKNPKFVLIHDETGFAATIATYSRYEIDFRKMGDFSYVEYLGEIEGISAGTLDIDVRKLGRGIGLLEEAKGYAL